MGTSWVALSITNIKTQASRETTSRKISKSYIALLVMYLILLSGAQLIHNMDTAVSLNNAMDTIYGCYHIVIEPSRRPVALVNIT